MPVKTNKITRFILMTALLFPLLVTAQTKSFITKFHPLVDSLSAEYGIPPSLIFGVSIIESSSGTSRNCKLLNNYFGIVGKNNLLKTKGIKTRYKQYEDATASFIHFCRVVSKKKYYKKLKGNGDYRLWTEAMSQHGYSEVPAVWRSRINEAIRKNKLGNLSIPKKDGDLAEEKKDKKKD
jgi:flagellum-specific peptidoglycan hydrolase FlgJ